MHKRLFEHHRLIFIHQHPILEHQPECADQDSTLDLLTRLHHIRHRKGMVYRDDLLCDDGSVIQLFGYKMSGGSDEFNTAFECLPVGISPGESRQKGVMDIDDPRWKIRHKDRRQDTHEFRQHDIIRLIAEQDIDDLLFKAFLIQLLVGYMEKGYFKTPADILEDGIVADDALHGCPQRLEMMPHQDISETMIFLRHQHGNLFLHAQVNRNHGVIGEDGSKPRLQPRYGGFPIHVHPDKKAVFSRVDMLTQRNDIEFFFRQYTRDGGDQTYLVLALNNEDHSYKLVNYRPIAAAGLLQSGSHNHFVSFTMHIYNLNRRIGA